MPPVICSMCGQRRAKRDCPAAGHAICAVCCGTKREVEIACPPSCSYLSSARTHPAATVQRRRERDYRFLLPFVAELTEQQYRLLLAFQAVTLKHAGSVVPSPLDADVRDAAATVASTLETSQKGIIYEHQAASIPAQRLATEYGAMLAEIQKQGPVPGLERDAVVVLRRIEQGVSKAQGAFAEDGDRAYLALLARVMTPSGAPADARDATAGDDHPGSIIIP